MDRLCGNGGFWERVISFLLPGSETKESAKPPETKESAKLPETKESAKLPETNKPANPLTTMLLESMFLRYIWFLVTELPINPDDWRVDNFDTSTILGFLDVMMRVLVSNSNPTLDGHKYFAILPEIYTIVPWVIWSYSKELLEFMPDGVYNIVDEYCNYCYLEKSPYDPGKSPNEMNELQLRFVQRLTTAVKQAEHDLREFKCTMFANIVSPARPFKQKTMRRNIERKLDAMYDNCVVWSGIWAFLPPCRKKEFHTMHDELRLALMRRIAEEYYIHP